MQAKKIIIYALVGILAIFFLKSIFGSFKSNVTISNKQTNATRTLDSFWGIDVRDGVEVELIKSDQDKIEIKTGDEFLKDVITEVDGGILKIHIDKSLFSDAPAVKAKVFYTSDLTEINANSASEISGSDTLTSDLEIEASSAGHIKLFVHNQKTDVEVSSAAEIELLGSSNEIEADASSAGALELKALKTNKCRISASSGANAKINVKDELNADVSSGANIEYMGSPATLKKDESSGGEVTNITEDN